MFSVNLKQPCHRPTLQCISAGLCETPVIKVRSVVHVIWCVSCPARWDVNRKDSGKHWFFGLIISRNFFSAVGAILEAEDYLISP